MACSPVTYHGVTPKVFTCMKKNLQKAGIKVPAGKSGTISGKGISAKFKWDGASDLWIQVTKKPFIVSCAYVNGKIHDAIEACGGK
ncbi:MAG: hypothetical protein GY839_10495 [candidate division Zixibacteria bacterium]|nr:hypothetical protein [candidate division Zixibacteria bacterium]